MASCSWPSISTLSSSCAPVIGIRKVFAAKHSRCSTFIKTQPCNIVTGRFSHLSKPLVWGITRRLQIPKFRAYNEGRTDSGSSVDGEDLDIAEAVEQDVFDSSLEFQSQDNGIEIEIEKTGNNSRRIRSKVVIQASLQCVWDLLTDYEKLADYIPSLAVSQLLEKRENFARLFQIGQQDLAFGLKFSAKGVIDCVEKDLLTLPLSQKRDIEFKMVEGDFQLFEGVWSMEQGMDFNGGELHNDSTGHQESQTTLIYVVEVKPKLWLPVRLVEGRLCKDIKTNLSSIRDEAENAFRNAHSAL